MCAFIIPIPVQSSFFFSRDRSMCLPLFLDIQINLISFHSLVQCVLSVLGVLGVTMQTQTQFSRDTPTNLLRMFRGQAVPTR